MLTMDHTVFHHGISNKHITTAIGWEYPLHENVLIGFVKISQTPVTMVVAEGRDLRTPDGISWRLWI